jgi:hypothetical protein
MSKHLRRGLLGPFQLGALNAFQSVLKSTETATGRRTCNIESLFYVTAFQVGIDQFLMLSMKDEDRPKSAFVRARTAFIATKRAVLYHSAIRNVFSNYLPNDWERDDEFSAVWQWSAFLVDLICAMEHGASLLAISGIPKVSDVEALLPSELLLPITTLANTFETVQVPSIAPTTNINRDDIERFQALMLSDLFSGYVRAQETLEDEGVTPPGAVASIIQAGRQIVKTCPLVLAMRQSVASILSLTPELVDAAFGHLLGALTGIAAKLGSDYRERRRRVVVYDFEDQVLSVTVTNLLGAMESSGEED